MDLVDLWLYEFVRIDKLILRVVLERFFFFIVKGLCFVCFVVLNEGFDCYFLGGSLEDGGKFY